jgi:hypothetical protein
MTGDAEPTMMRPNTQRTPTTRARAREVLIRGTPAVRSGRVSGRLRADKGVTVAVVGAERDGRGVVGVRRGRVAVPVEVRSAMVFPPS